MSKDVIHVSHAHKSYSHVKAVDDLSFTVEEAVCFGFLGPNGAGKTTMMKMLYGKAEPDKGNKTKISVFGFNPAKDELKIKSLSGVVSQEDNLDTELNVKQNMNIYALLHNIPLKEADKRIDYLLDFMELGEKKNVKIRELSGGMKRRLVMARALLNDPSLLILDEPTTGLDPQVRLLIWEKLHTLKKSGVTILLTTHYMEEAFQIADTVMIMDRGRKILQGNPKELLDEHIESHVMEISCDHSEDEFQRFLNNGVIRREQSRDRNLYYSSDVGLLEKLAKNCETGDYFIRRVNLEDLFLKATGRKLSEIQ